MGIPPCPDSPPPTRSARSTAPAARPSSTLNGRDFYLGPHGTQASRDEYDRLIGEWLQNGRRLHRPSGAGPADLTVVELVAAFWEHAQTYYFQPGGHSGELGSIRLALAYLKRLYGRTEAAAFGPLALKTVRQSMVDAGWSRRYVNRQVDRLRRLFRWAAEEEMLSAQVYQALRTVPGLRQGKTQAYEPEPVKPVPEEHVYAIKDFVSRQVWAMIELQMLSGMRPGEVVVMRTGDVDTTGALWTYRPAKHKTQYRGHERTVYFGPKAQAVLAPFLRPDLQAFIFSPSEGEAERLKKLHAERVTPLSHGNVPGSNRLRNPGRKPGSCYSVSSYRRAIATACERAFGMPRELHEPETQKQKAARAAEDPKARRAARETWHAQHVWHPHQLRHNAATRLRKDYGLEAAQVILGHKTLAVTQVYAERDVAAAQRVMAEVG